MGWLRYARDGSFVAVMLNFTPVPRTGYRIGLPHAGCYRELLNSDSSYYGGSDMGNGDGLIAHDAVTLGGRVRTITIEDRDANHLNLAGVSNPFGTVFRGFTRNDRIWPRVVATTAAALEEAFATAPAPVDEPVLR
jgi:hypothetical protein